MIRCSLHAVLIRVATPLLALLLLSSCASFPNLGGSEPRIIVIRNRSGADIDTVTLRGADAGSQASRFGSISPVPAGASQEYIRPTDPPRLPGTVTVEWVDHQGGAHARPLSLSKALRSSTGGAGEALVFEIWHDGDVLVFIESDRR